MFHSPQITLKNGVIVNTLTATVWMQCCFLLYWITFYEKTCQIPIFWNPYCPDFFILNQVLDGCCIYFHSALCIWQRCTPWLFPSALHTFRQASAQIIVPLLISHPTVGPNTSTTEEDPSQSITCCVTTSESAFHLIRWESPVWLTSESFVFGFF